MERELERMDRKDDQRAIELGIKDPLADAVEEREHKQKMQHLREKNLELKIENDKLLPIGLLDPNKFNRRMGRTAASGFGHSRKKREEPLIEEDDTKNKGKRAAGKSSYRSAK